MSKDVFKAFEKAIDQKLNNPKSQFYSLIIEGVESASIEKNTIKITVIFLSEQLKNNDENSIVKKQDIWTFEKDINKKNPVWTLTST